MSLRTKVLFLSIGLSLVGACVGLSNFLVNLSVQKKYGVIITEDIPKLEAVSEMYIAYQQVRIAIRTLGLPGLTKDQIHEAVSATKKAVSSYETKQNILLSLPVSVKERELRIQNTQAWLDFKEIVNAGLKIQQEGKPDWEQQLRQVFLTTCPVAAGHYLDSVTSLKKFYQDAMSNSSKTAEATQNRGVRISVTIIVIGVLGGLIAGSLMAIRISGRLKRVSQEMEGNSSIVVQTANSLTESSQQLNQNSHVQSASIQQTASSIEEIRAMVKRNHEGSLQSIELSELSKTHAQDGHNSVKEMIESMHGIQEFNNDLKKQMEVSNRKMSDVINVIREIGAKTTVINDIVFQTKLLSFNASVEAARAGEHGKGFSVVAEEVGHLANMSGRAAQEITALLDSSRERVQELSKEADATLDNLMSQSQKKLEEGTAIAQKCGVVLDQIVNSAMELSNITNSITQASKEQSLGVDEIARAVGELDKTLQSNHSETERTSDSASQLNDQARLILEATKNLEQLVSGRRAA